MALSAVRSVCLNYSKAVFSKSSLFRPVVKRSFVGLNQTKSLCQVNEVKMTNILKPSVCWMHTKGDEELAAFLSEEIENEKKSQHTSGLPKIPDFEIHLSGADVELSRKIDGETILISANVNGSVDAEETMDLNEDTKDPPEPAEMKAKPDFEIKVIKHKKTLCFQCSFVEAGDHEEYKDSFQISEVSMFEGEEKDSTYSVSGDIMDGYLYDLLMNFLEERGISNDFVDRLTVLYTAYEHQLYINLLQDMKHFVKKEC